MDNRRPDKSKSTQSTSYSPNRQLSDADTVGLIVHSYNNYLSAMMGYSELALMEDISKDAKERVSEVILSGDQAVVFGKELLSSLSRVQLRAVPLTVRDLLLHLSEKLAIPIAQFENESYHTVAVALDLNWFTHCIEKVIQFSADFAKGIGDTNLSAWLKNEDSKQVLEIEISNSNLRLDDSIVERLSQPFFTSRQLLGQKDVGLAVVSGYLEQLKGNFSWSEKMGAFNLRLPVVNSDN